MLFPSPAVSSSAAGISLDRIAARAAAPFVTPHAAPVTLYLLCTSACFLCSASFHTVCGHASRTVYGAGLRADAVGVLLLMWSSTVPLVEFVLPDSVSGVPGSRSTASRSLQIEGAKTLHHIVIGAVAAAGVAAMLCSKRLNSPDNGASRAALFASFAVVGFGLPLGHAALLFSSSMSQPSGKRLDWHCEDSRSWLRWVGWTAVCNTLGWGVYGIKVSKLFLRQKYPHLARFYS